VYAYTFAHIYQQPFIKPFSFDLSSVSISMPTLVITYDGALHAVAEVRWSTMYHIPSLRFLEIFQESHLSCPVPFSFSSPFSVYPSLGDWFILHQSSLLYRLPTCNLVTNPVFLVIPIRSSFSLRPLNSLEFAPFETGQMALFSSVTGSLDLSSFRTKYSLHLRRHGMSGSTRHLPSAGTLPLSASPQEVHPPFSFRVSTPTLSTSVSSVPTCLPRPSPLWFFCSLLHCWLTHSPLDITTHIVLHICRGVTPAIFIPFPLGLAFNLCYAYYLKQTSFRLSAVCGGLGPVLLPLARTFSSCAPVGVLRVSPLEPLVQDRPRPRSVSLRPRLSRSSSAAL
jgi:hypothetical protein